MNAPTTSGQRLLAIDPGDVVSGWVVVETGTCEPIAFGRTDNHELARLLPDLIAEHHITETHIEMIASYGMAVGSEVFETCVWIGRYLELCEALGCSTTRTVRLRIKLHHCHVTGANDATVRRALVERFAPGARNHGKGTKDNPTWFYGFHRDIWAAYALAVYACDTRNGTAAWTPDYAAAA